MPAARGALLNSSIVRATILWSTSSSVFPWGKEYVSG